jgi:Protein of unknown function (DUF1552)
MSTYLKREKDMSAKTSPKISRRLVLKGAGGVSVALPFLASALWTRRAGAAAITAPRRFMAWFIPNGFNMQGWTPVLGTKEGVKNWVANTISMPLEPIRNKILIISGTDNQAIAIPGNPPGDHGAGCGMFLNMLSVNGNLTSTARTSMDQMLLPYLNPAGSPQPKFPSLQLGLQGDNGLCDRVDCTFSRALSWIKGAPQPNIYDPALLWDKLFKGYVAPPPSGATTPDPAATAAAAAAKQLQTDQTSVLDLVLAQATSINTKLSTSDKAKLDQFTTSLRAVELQIKNISTGGGGGSVAGCMPNTKPAGGEVLNFDRGITPSTILQSHMPALRDLMVLAFQCDMTRSLTFMLGNGTSNNDYTFLTGSGTPHHATSHHDGNADKLAKLLKIGAWEVGMAATMLQAMDKVNEGDGTLLDHTTFYLGSDISDGATHNHWDMPVFIAGGGNGKMAIDGRHIQYVTHPTTPRALVGPMGGPVTGRILIGIMQAHGMPDTSLGLCTGGPLPEIMKA